MRYKRIMILAILLVSLLAVSAVSAAENITDDIASIDNADDNQTIDESSNEDILSGTNDGTFTELQNKIDKAAEGSTIYLDKDYKYDEGFSKEGIVISKNLTIAGNGHTLDGLSKSRILYVTTTNPRISLKDINFCNGYGDEDGGAVYIPGPGSSWVKKTISLSVQNCNFTNNLAETCGGAIYAYGDILYMNVLKCSFINNKVLGWGGAGAIHAPSPYGGDGLTVSYSTFINNTASSDDGGAIYCGKGHVNNCYFKDNTAAKEGGAIGSDYGVDIYNSVFINNEAKYGGAVVSRGTTSTIQNCSFSLNKAKLGGAVYTFAGTTVKDCKFTSNIATDKGGAMYFLAKTSNIYNSAFASNTAENGGAIYNVEVNPYVGSEVIVNAIECIFKSNKASLNQHVYGVNTIDCTFGSKSLTLTARYDSVSKNIVATVKDEDGKAVSGIKVGFAIDGVKYATTDANGQAKYSTSGLANKKYSVTVMAYGDEIYDDSNKVTVTFDLSKIKTTLTAPNVVTTYNSGKNLVATLKDANGKAISGAKVTIKLGTTTKTLTTNSNGQVSMTTNGLAPNIYTATITFAGDNTYDSSSTTAKVTINDGQKQQAKIFLRNALYFVLQTKMVQVTLWDANNNPIAGKTVYINLDEYGLKYSGVTDENGNAYIRVGVGFGNHPATVSFEGDDQYNPDSKTGRVRVIKETPSLMLPGKYTKFKATDPVKTVKIYLKDRYDKPLLPGTKVFIKVNGQTYSGLIDLNGIAYIDLKINTKGTYNTELIYTGNTAYNAVRKTTKITIV